MTAFPGAVCDHWVAAKAIAGTSHRSLRGLPGATPIRSNKGAGISKTTAYRGM